MKYCILTGLLFILMVSKSGSQQNHYDPPWNPALQGDVYFTVKGVDNVPDIYGDINDPQLVIFMGGNQFMVLDDLLAAFRNQYPQYERILVETLPPGLLFQQLKKGTLVMGNMRISLKPDIYTAGKKKLEENMEMFSQILPYSTNKLALMVAKGNPKKITGLKDLSRNDIRISMPDKKIEGIGEVVEDAYLKAGGEKLHKTIMHQKVKDGSTFITQIHHRQSPLRILYKQSDVAPVWTTEVLYQNRIGNTVQMIPIPDAYNKTSVSAAGILKDAPNKEAAQHFLKFLGSAEAKAVFKKYGFDWPQSDE